MAAEDYVAVAADDWYQRRRDDEEGKFFRKVADQGPRKGDGGSTRQGIYVLTADGKLLAYKNAGQDADVMRDVLKQGLREWQKLPQERRQPGAVKVEDAGKDDARFSRTPPPGGLVVNVFTRILDHDGQKELCRGTCKTLGGDRPSRDHLWLTADDVKALVPAGAKKGDRFPLPAKVAERLLRFHLVDNTRGEPPHWTREQVRSQELTLTVEEANDRAVRLRLDGSALLATAAEPARADRGFDVRLLGYLGYDVGKKAVDRFEVVAVGDHWGEGTFTRRARPGKMPLGVVFELASGKASADQVPPQGARNLQEYLGR